MIWIDSSTEIAGIAHRIHISHEFTVIIRACQRLHHHLKGTNWLIMSQSPVRRHPPPVLTIPVHKDTTNELFPALLNAEYGSSSTELVVTNRNQNPTRMGPENPDSIENQMMQIRHFSIQVNLTVHSSGPPTRSTNWS